LDQLLFSVAFWEANTALLLAGIMTLALVVGSFLNVVILRLPVMMDLGWRRECQELLATPPLAAPEVHRLSLAFPPSTCPRCGHRIRAYENVPVVSYLLLRGRCARCREPISARYPLIEAATALLSAVVAWRLGVGWPLAGALMLTWSLIALAVIDLDHQLLPDSITLPLLWAGLILNSQGLFVPLESAVWGAAGGYLALWTVYWVFKLVTGKDGMGHGDFKLLAALGAWLGAEALPLIVILSSFIGAAVGLALILLRGRDRNVPLPFGPFLAGAGWVVLLWGGVLGTAWRQLTGAP